MVKGTNDEVRKNDDEYKQNFSIFYNNKVERRNLTFSRRHKIYYKENPDHRKE